FFLGPTPIHRLLPLWKRSIRPRLRPRKQTVPVLLVLQRHSDDHPVPSLAPIPSAAESTLPLLLPRGLSFHATRSAGTPRFLCRNLPPVWMHPVRGTDPPRFPKNLG